MTRRHTVTAFERIWPDSSAIRDTLDLSGSEPWIAGALCAQVDHELFYPERGSNSAAAKAVCRHCPVIAECLAYAIANNETWGVWGGMSERQRQRLHDVERIACSTCRKGYLPSALARHRSIAHPVPLEAAS